MAGKRAAESQEFDVIFFGVNTIDYAADVRGKFPELMGANLGRMSPMRTHPGGIGNGAPVAAKMLGPGKVGCITLLAPDANGRSFDDFMKSHGVDAGGIMWTNQLPPDTTYETIGLDGRPIRLKASELSTGMSCVANDPATKKPLILYSAGVNDVIGIEHIDMEYVRKSKSFVISYGTLLPRLDYPGGRPMAKLIRDVRDMGVLTVLDTHSIPEADYRVLERPIKEADVFACNMNEALGLTGLGASVTREDLIVAIANKMNINGKRSRLIAITDGGKPAVLAYAAKGSRDLRISTVEACKVEVADSTGAGDTFKVGLTAYLVRNRKAFDDGSLNLTEAGRFAHASSAGYISGKGVENVRDYSGTAAFMRGRYAQAQVQEITLTPDRLHSPRRLRS